MFSLLEYSHSSGDLILLCAVTAAGMAATFGLSSGQLLSIHTSRISCEECAAPVAMRWSGPPCHCAGPSSDQPDRMTYLYWMRECAGSATVTFQWVPLTQSISMPLEGVQLPRRSCPPTRHT